MKIIDLFNDMANHKSLPDKIKLQCVNYITKDNNIYTFNPINETYLNKRNAPIQNATYLGVLLNLEYEIIKENKQ